MFDRFMGSISTLAASKTVRIRLNGLLHELLDSLVTSVTPRDCERAYEAVQQKWAVATHRHGLKMMNRFFNFCVKEQVIKMNPASNVKPTGRPRRGKPQLRVDEARRFVNIALRRAAEGNAKSLAAAMVLLLGTRSGETSDRLVRDVDDGGRLLHTNSKTEAGTRILEIPKVLRELILARCEGKKPLDRLFSRSMGSKELWREVHRICDLAGVPRVCPHGLRGSHGTIAIQGGQTAEMVAAQLGHASTAITTQHYIAPGTIEGQQRRRVELTLLEGGAGNVGNDAESDRSQRQKTK